MYENSPRWALSDARAAPSISSPRHWKRTPTPSVRKPGNFDLLLVPSDSFGVKGYVRLAYCIDTEKVKRSLPAFEKLAAAYRK